MTLQKTAHYVDCRVIQNMMSSIRFYVELNNDRSRWRNQKNDLLGVTLDRTLSYKKHIHNTKMKVVTRNNLLKKLSNSKWGCNASSIRTTALALSYSAAEYAYPVWARSPHASKLDPELNDGGLRPTNVEELYLFAGIAPPDIRRDVCARVEKKKQETNAAHSLHGQVPAERPLKRECFRSSDQQTSLQKSSAEVNGNTGRFCHYTTALLTWIKV